MSFVSSFKMIVFGVDLCFTADVFYFFFFNARSLSGVCRLAQNFALWFIVGHILKIRSRNLGDLTKKN